MDERANSVKWRSVVPPAQSASNVTRVWHTGLGVIAPRIVDEAARLPLDGTGVAMAFAPVPVPQSVPGLIAGHPRFRGLRPGAGAHVGADQ